MNVKNLNLNKKLLFAKSFCLLGDSLDFCYDCKYCRLNGEREEERHYQMLPSMINDSFLSLPVAVNLFYGDPLLQIDNTVKYLRMLEDIHHKGPVILVTKGDFSRFPDISFALDLHIAFSTFGVNHFLDGNTMERFENNLKQIHKRKNNYKYSIEFRPIVYGINDSMDIFKRVIGDAKEYNLAIGYSGLQGKKESVSIWEREGIPLHPYPGYSFGHKKIIAPSVVSLFESLAKEEGVPVFRKTSCLFSYVHHLDRDYNAHYYRPNEMNCQECVMKNKCFQYKEQLQLNLSLGDIIPFDYEIVEKIHHECILKKQGLCEYPTEDCSRISGKLIQINDIITTSDVRVLKWLTGYTVDALFIESPYISSAWTKKKVR